MNPFFFRVWVGPDWKSFQFSNISKGDVFTPTAAWTQIPGDRGRLSIDIDMMDNLAAYTWRMTLGGYNVRESLFTPDKLLLIEAGDTPDSSGWTVYAYGVIDTVNTDSDYTAANDWNVRVVSVSERLQRQDLLPVRVGDLDMAKGATVTVSSSLGARWKESVRHRDVSSPQNNFDGSHAVDGDPDTLWVSDAFVGDAQDRSTMELLSMVQPVLSPDIYFGTRFVEVVKLVHSASMQLWAYDADVGTFNVLGTTGQPDLGRLASDGDSLLIVEDARAFDAYYPSATQFDVKYDLSQDKDIERRNWFRNSVRPHKGIIAIRHTGIGGYPRVANHVAWGNWTESEWRALESSSGSSPPPNFWPDSGSWVGWSDANIVRAPNYYEVIRKAGGNWYVDTLQHPGTNIQTYVTDTSGAYEYSREAWMVVDLPPMGHVLGKDVDAGDTIMHVEDGEGYPWVEGMPSAGRIFVDDEILTYTNRNFDTGVLTLASGAANDHHAGTDIKVESELTPGRFVNGWPLDLTHWSNEDYPVPRDYMYRWAEHELASDPDNAYHRHTYNLWHPKIGNTALYDNVGHNVAVRARRVCMEIGRMTATGGGQSIERPRIGTFTLRAKRSYFDTNRWLDQLPSEDLIKYMIGLAGGNLNVRVAGRGLPRREGVTDIASAWMVIVDAAQYGNSFIEVRLDNEFVVRPNNILTGSWNHTRTYNMLNAKALRVEQVRDYELGQMELTWETPDGSDGGEAYYPATKPSDASLRKQGPQLFSDVTQAQVAVQRLYHINKYPHRIFLELAVSDDDVRPGEIHEVVWDYRGATRTLTCLVESVELSVSNQTMRVNVQYQELQRS